MNGSNQLTSVRAMQSMEESVARDNHSTSAMKQLNVQTKYLIESVNKLVERLNPVLRPRQVEPSDPSKMPPEEAFAPLPSEIRSRAKDIESVVADLNWLHQNLEV